MRFLNKILLTFLLQGLPVFAEAQCQLCLFTVAEVLEIRDFLRTQEELVLYSGCEYNDLARRIRIDSVYYQLDEGMPDRRYAIHIKGTILGFFAILNQQPTRYTPEQQAFEGSIDLAYTHIKVGGYYDQALGKYIWDAKCLGIYLGFACDPCTDPFDYPDYP
ncbi:hypothetical protein [Eisenibacter elegans]|jgi:hypothetical protein|uniref:hypothetical protein n=1 Tax=Eisenibacter elegans TaxID=997 RepID=UPI00047DE256|nr:hypothetical protein [Eisenibacter elegans]